MKRLVLKPGTQHRSLAPVLPALALLVVLAATHLAPAAAGTGVASAVDRRPPLALTPTSFGVVKVGTPLRQGQSALTHALGRPSAVVDGGCPFAQEHARYVSWGSAVTAVFSDLAGGGIRLRGWLVRRGSSSNRVSLPYGIRIGVAADSARRVIPASQGRFDQTFGTFLITSPRAPGVVWFSDLATGRGPITSISLNPTFCD